MLRRPIQLLAALVTVAALGASAAPAFAASPWWHLSSTSLPTSDLHAGVAQNTVYELSYQASEGDFVLAASEETLSSNNRLVAWDASPETVQADMRELYPASKVTVGGKPGDYQITFPGQAPEKYAYVVAGKLKPFVNAAFAGFFGGEPLKQKGVEETVEPTVTELFAGHPDGQVVVTATNLGDAEANGEAGDPITLAAKLPPGLEAVAVSGTTKSWTHQEAPAECTLTAAGEPATVRCTSNATLHPYESVALVVSVVDVGAQAGEGIEGTVSGGGARSVSREQPAPVGGTSAFGVSQYELANEDEGGAPDTQAGSHPFQQTTTVALNQKVNVGNGTVQPVELPKDLHFKWPAGLIGNPTAVPECPLALFLENVCPPQTAVGVANLLVTQSGPFGGTLLVTNDIVPVYNLAPSPGEPARFGFQPVKPVYIDPSVRSGEDYGINVNTENITQVAAFLSAQVTIWGVPGESSHDDVRGTECLTADLGAPHSCEPVKTEHPSGFLSLPTSCTGALSSQVFGDSWADPKPTAEQPVLATAAMPALDGCDALPFRPELKATPDGTQGSKPTGLNVDVHVPQEESTSPEGLAVAAPRDITVTLPEGMVVNPASADGLQACSEGLVGFEGFKELGPGFSPATFTPKLPGSFSSEEALEPGVNFCPDASKIGTVRIKTPILPNPIEGDVYLAAQDANPFGSLVAMYIVAEDPISGVLIKLAGQVHLSATGQIVTTFEDSPQAPFEDAELHFFGGERAPLATPAHCGTYTATAGLTPWSGTTSVPASSSFQVTSGPNGSACPGATLPFAPTLSAQTTNIQAGAFTPLVTTIGREDGGQDIEKVQLHMPPGLSGILTGVPLCPEAQANAGTCPETSLIGKTVVSVGLGGDPFSVTGGKVYLTEKYEGAPFGLSIVNPAVAGPFDLGKVIVRARIEVDPHTAELTITTGQIPHILDGIPLQIKHVNVTIDRPGFTFNPTDCDPFAITGSIGSDEGVSSPVAVPFQVTNCAALKFAPKFAVSTAAKTSKANGASLNVKLTYPQGPAGTYANIARVKVDLPKQLPSRLTTLQKACTAAQFNTNPAGCPTASIIGHAKAITPLIPVPLEGPAYFVSHGGEAFPSLIIVLQGYGVTLDLVGTTFISKAGVTSSTFKTVPDAPVGSFELNLPEGKFSALAALTNLCKTKLKMPTEFLAQNGAKINESTKIGVTGCPRVKKAKHKKKHTSDNKQKESH